MVGDCLHTAKQVLDELGHVCPLCRIAALEARNAETERRAEAMADRLKEWRSTRFFDDQGEWQEWVGEFGARVDDATDAWDRPLPGDDERIAALVATQKPRGGEEWHERHGTVLWFTEPIDEPPYCGTPLDQDFPWVSTRIEKLLWVPLPAIFNREVDRG